MLQIYTTFPDLDEARRVSKLLLEERLVACVNILPMLASMYWWDGVIQDEDEVAAFYKTSEDSFEAM